MRLIDADSLEKDANDDLFNCPDTVEEVYWNDGAKSIIDLIKTAPTIDPVKHGEWLHGREIAREMIGDIITDIIYEDWKCSDCGCTVEEGKPVWNYCPNCGAKMDGGEG